MRRGWMMPTVAETSSSQSIWSPAETQASWLSGSSNVARLLGRSTMQPASEASRLRPLSAAAASRRFTEQPCPSPAWGTISTGTLGAEPAERSVQSQDGQHGLLKGAAVSGNTEQGQGAWGWSHLSSLPHKHAEAGDSEQAQGTLEWPQHGSLPPQETQSDSSPLAQHSWLDGEVLMHEPANKFGLRFGNAGMNKTASGQQHLALSQKADSSLSKLHMRASFTSGMQPASSGLKAYWTEASASHPDDLSNKGFHKASGRASDAVLALNQHTVKRPSLISTRFSQQSIIMAEGSRLLTGLHSTQRPSSLTFHATLQSSSDQQEAQHQVPAFDQRNSSLYSAESVQPQKLRPSMLADAVLSLPQQDATDTQQQQQQHLLAEASPIRQTDRLLPLQSQIRQSPVAAALSDDSPWDSTPGSLHLRHQNTWHLPSAVQPHTQQQQQPFRQHPSMLQSPQDSQANSRQAWMWSEAGAGAAATGPGSIAESDSQAAVKQLSPLDDDGLIERCAHNPIKVVATSHEMTRPCSSGLCWLLASRSA